MINVEYQWFLALIILLLLVYWLIPRARQDEQLALKTPFFEQLESQIGNASKYNFKRANYLKYLLSAIWILLILLQSKKCLMMLVLLYQDHRQLSVMPSA